MHKIKKYQYGGNPYPRINFNYTSTQDYAKQYFAPKPSALSIGTGESERQRLFTQYMTEEQKRQASEKRAIDEAQTSNDAKFNWGNALNVGSELAQGGFGAYLGRGADTTNFMNAAVPEIGNMLGKTGNPLIGAGYGAALWGTRYLTGRRVAQDGFSQVLNSPQTAATLFAINPWLGGGYMALGLANQLGGTSLDKYKYNNLQDEMDISNVIGSYQGAGKNIDYAKQHSGESRGLLDRAFGGTKKANRKILAANNASQWLLNENEDMERRRANANMDKQSLNYWENLNGGYQPMYVKQGKKLPTKQDIEKVRNILSKPKLAQFKSGGSIIPEGALHARKNNMEGAGKDFTHKGIPVMDKDGNQQAEIERNEIIFSLEVTKKLELYAKQGTEEAALKAGKLLVDEIFNNTDDRTGLITELTGEVTKHQQGGTLTFDESLFQENTLEFDESDFEDYPGVNYYQKGGKTNKRTPKEVWMILNSNPEFDDMFIDEPEYDDDLRFSSQPQSVRDSITEEEWEDFLDDLYNINGLVEEAKKQNPRFIQRLMEPPRGIEFTDDQGNKVKGSHYLESSETDNGSFVYPRIQEMEDGSLKILPSREARLRAIKNNNIVKFDRFMDAFRFATRYKRHFPEFFNNWK